MAECEEVVGRPAAKGGIEKGSREDRIFSVKEMNVYSFRGVSKRVLVYADLDLDGSAVLTGVRTK